MIDVAMTLGRAHPGRACSAQAHAGGGCDSGPALTAHRRYRPSLSDRISVSQRQQSPAIAWERGYSVLSEQFRFNHTGYRTMVSENYDKGQLKRIIARELSQMAESGELKQQAAADEREQLAESALVVRDARRISEGNYSSASSYILDEYGVSVEDFSDTEELQAALATKRSELREQQVGRRAGFGGE